MRRIEGLRNCLFLKRHVEQSGVYHSLHPDELFEPSQLPSLLAISSTV